MACELAEFAICIPEGTEYKLVLSPLDDNDLPVDLTGATAELQLKVMNVVTVYPGAVNGNSITYTIPATETFTALRGKYQAEYTIGVTTVVRMLRGDVTIERNF